MNKVNGVQVGKAAQLVTGQTVCYAARDDGDLQKGIPKPTARYQVNTTGPFLGTKAIYVPTFAQNDLVFTVIGRTITSVTGGLNIVKTNDIIRIRGSISNDGEYLVSGGNNANTITLDATTPPLAGETSAVYITIAKQQLHSNNTVLDLNTGLTWLRDRSGIPGTVGAASSGQLSWTATPIAIHPANNDLQMIAGGKGVATVKIIGGAGEVLKYWPGYGYVFTAFANAVNLLPGFLCQSVAINGIDLDIVLDTGNQTCISEAAGVNGAIQLACNGIFCFAKACNIAAVGGFSDWRVPNINEYIGLCIYDPIASTAIPDTTAFPNSPTIVWSGTIDVTLPATRRLTVYFTSGGFGTTTATTPFNVMLVRGG